MNYIEIPNTPRGQSAKVHTTRYPDVKTVERCKDCGRRIRSEKHTEGKHHSSRTTAKK